MNEHQARAFGWLMLAAAFITACITSAYTDKPLFTWNLKINRVEHCDHCGHCSDNGQSSESDKAE